MLTSAVVLLLVSGAAVVLVGVVVVGAGEVVTSAVVVEVLASAEVGSGVVLVGGLGFGAPCPAQSLALTA